ncbi:MAG: hydrogen gas-evolving membrane-bound hydrogenase subunit E [Planctomycetota bacterium]
MVLVLVLLLLGAVVALPLGRRLAGTAAFVLPLPMAAGFVELLRRVPAVVDGARPRIVLGGVDPLGAEMALRLQPLGLLFALLVTGIGALVIVHAAGYLASKPRILARFTALAYLFAFAMVGLVLADDLLLLFVFWELTSVCSFLLIGLKYEEEPAREGAMRALFVTGAGGIALLVGLLMLATAADTTSLSVLLERGDQVRASSLYVPALVFVLIGGFTKSAQVPFHYWLPGAMAAPSPVSAFLHSATLVKAGVFLLALLHPVLGFRAEWHALLGPIGALTMLVGAVLAFGQDDLKKMLAYTTVAGLGTIMMLLGIGTEPAVRAAMLFTAVHALYKASLFMVVGYLDQRTGTRDVGQLRGLARAAPFAFAAGLLAALSMSGLPPLLGAIAKELVYEAKLGMPEAPTALPVVGSVANALIIACALLAGIAPFLRRGTPPELRPVAGVRLLLGPVVLAGVGLLLGLLHDTLGAPLLDAASGAVVGEPVTEEFARDEAPALVGLVGNLTLAAGVAAFFLRGRLVASAGALRKLPAFGPTALHDRLLGGIYAVGGAVSKATSYRVVRTSMLVSLVLLLLLTGPPLLRAVGTPGFAIGLPEALLMLLVAAGAIATVRARRAVTAVAALGVAGFGIGMLFLLRGGPDLALTQIAVETMAVLLLLTVLQRRPLTESAPQDGKRVLDNVIALAVGAVFTGLAWAAAPDGTLRAPAEAIAKASEPEGFGRNVVNVILVDFRALDTMGEIFVLAIAALGVTALLRRVPRPAAASLPAAPPILRATAGAVVPLLGLLSLVLFARGHHEPGGGFVGGLVAASAAMLYAFAFGIKRARKRVSPARLIAAGLALALGAGAIGLLFGGTFLTGVWIDAKIPAVGKLGTPLLFDTGVFLVVFGVTTGVLLELLVREETA